MMSSDVNFSRKQHKIAIILNSDWQQSVHSRISLYSNIVRKYCDIKTSHAKVKSRIRVNYFNAIPGMES